MCLPSNSDIIVLDFVDYLLVLKSSAIVGKHKDAMSEVNMHSLQQTHQDMTLNVVVKACNVYEVFTIFVSYIQTEIKKKTNEK